MRRTPIGLVLSFGIALAMSLPASAQLFQSSSGYAFALNVENPATVQPATGTDLLTVSLSGAAMQVDDLIDTLWLEDFTYEASLLGSGSVTWGSAAGSLQLAASTDPETSPPVPGSGQQAAVNVGSAQAGGSIFLRFTELGVVSSQTLAAGTPVTVELNCTVGSTSFVSASLDAPNETRVGASGECRITDESGGFTQAEIFVAGNEVETKSLASAVGHTLEIEGVFRVVGDAFAGPGPCCMDFLGDAQAEIEGYGGLWLGLPAGVGVTGASGHDYAVPLPEPGGVACVSMAVLMLVACGRLPAYPRRPGSFTR